MACFDELQGKHFKLFEIITRKGDLIGIIAQPSHIFFNLSDKLMRFFVWIGIIVAQVANSSRSESRLEVDSDWFDVSDVQVAIGFRGKPKSWFASYYFEMLPVDFFGVAL